MISIKNILTMIAVCLAVTLSAQDDVQERLAIPLSSPGERVSIKVKLVNGNVEVVQYDGKEVIIEASAKADKDNKPEKVNGMTRISSVPFDISATEEDNEIEINTNSWQRRMNITIRTPRKTDLEVGTVQGQISVSNIDGVMELGSVNGGIKFDNVSGSVLSNTVNGDIKGSFERVNSNQSMSFVTLNGDVDITLPTSVKAQAKLKSDRGEIYTDFDMTITRSKPKVESNSKKYKVSVESWVTGEINGGGPEFTFKNMNGDIYLRKAQ